MRPDERILENVNDRLTDHPVLDASNNGGSVSGGEVTLHGHVDSRYPKGLAGNIAEDVSGITHVQNNLRVRQQGGTVGLTGHSGLGTTTISGSSISRTGTTSGSALSGTAGMSTGPTGTQKT
jgi:hypothetical protein